MTIARLKWADTAATDLHLMPGLSSPELVRLLRVDDLTDATLTQDQPLPADAKVTFKPQLKTGVDHGIEVTAAGEVTVKTLALRGHSFLLGVSLDQDPAITTRIRIHVHEKVSSLWLTPARLTVRQGSAQARFSVLGLFDQVLDGTVVVSEGVIGDITNWSPFRAPNANELTYVHLARTTTAALTWSATGGPITVDARTGVLTAPVESGPDTKVTATAAGLHADGTAVCGPSWSTHVRLAHLGGPGVKQVDTVPNILFLPDGFQDTDADKAQYNRLVGIVKDRLESRPHTRPYAALTGRVNYWRGWVPSPDAGVTVLDELDPSPAPGELPATAVPLPLPSATRPAAGWSLADVVNAIGLPNPADYPAGTTVESKIVFLQNVYDDLITEDLLRPRFAEWVALNDRLLLNERDTAFHMAFSERPSADVNLLEHLISPNPRRISDNDFNKFLDALRGPDDDVLPAGLWSTGKDRNRVVVLCRSSRYGGLASRRKVSDDSTGLTVGVSLAARPFHRVRLNDGGNGFDLKPDDIPTDVFYGVWLTVAHELGHSFGLGDEYGGKTAAPTPLKIRQVRATPNVQDRASLSADGTPAGAIDTSKIKWAEWPRIAKAGVLKNGMTAPAVGPFTVDLVDVKASRLRTDDIVMFRRRPLATAGPPSSICKIIAADPAANTVTVEPLFGATIAIFPAGSILLAYVRKPDPDFKANKFGGLLTLADPDVLQRITDTQNPLNANPMKGEADPPNDDHGRACGNVKLPVPTFATNFPHRAAPRPPGFSYWTIGLYENGSEHNCGIYRPTGTCVMNRQFFVEPKTKSVKLADFCIICRYAFVDNADPTLHGAVEADFRERYGKRGAR
ncbi:hypothetical protein QRX60_38225 [Amycolatopsis mongoliensis]|uniref:Uncharacterized protein n=1 Tax=Amycolatopsis mongoliensis TaxID=715475 RepID=A0A9Y2NFK8_9PSEU|nr:hypothetical protein [Amycolatopsis sp. 4-36]WIX99848.1 hypothetical protein QRX60_38225 [Amycolatopsis sp. 4-36]